MPEKSIILDEIDPKEFFGSHNILVDILRNHFPRLKIIARGNEIKCMGNDDDVTDFSRKIESLISYFNRHNGLSEDEAERILSDNEHELTASGGGFDEVIVFNVAGKPVTARTVNQFHLIEEYKRNDLLIAVGPAGTGKTYTSIALAVRALKNKEVRRIVLTRPAVEAGERLGFLPGDMKEKLDPYLQPLYDALKDMINFKKLETWLEDGTIQIVPLAFMRGRTLEHSFVILDEAQNSTMSQLKMFLTRMGNNSRFILTGDLTQIDLPNRHNSGLVKAVKLLEGIDGISIIEFDERDIVRHKLVKDIVRAYEKDYQQNLNKNQNTGSEHDPEFSVS
ncbi:MAG: PhoH family protein [Marinilabiliaceae bacterium]|jgi:phosphate starvation-inducible PhoH-like protein|nr:PhoH family protein [Marinilabiliaceae bacterium]